MSAVRNPGRLLRTPPAEPRGEGVAEGSGVVQGNIALPAALTAARDHAVLAAALDPIITIDAHGIIQSASDSVERVFGWSPLELVGRNVRVLMPEPYHSGHDSFLAAYRLTGETGILGRTREFEAVRKDGQRFPIELAVSRVDAPAGGLPLFVGIIRDITDRKRMERELRLVQDLALSISKASSLTIALVETIRQIALATGWDFGEAWTTSAGRDELEIAVSWFPPGAGLEQFAQTKCTINFHCGQGLPGRAWETGRPHWVGDLTALSPLEFCRPDAAKAAGLRAAAAVPILSENRPIAVLLFFMREPHPENLHLLELVHAAVAPLGTLIQRKRAEDELGEHQRRLEEKVEERTRALQESRDRLRLSDRLASIGTLAAGLGHDMNNVLLPVRAHLNALRAEVNSGGISASARRHVEAVRKSAAYLQQLADGLHYLAMDPDKVDIAAEDTDLSAWWAHAGVLLSKAVPKHVKVKASFPRDLPEVRISAAGLTQAVLNLVVNAGEAIPAGRKRLQGGVRVSAERHPESQSVWLRVTDNGAGMTDEVRRRAFEMFFTTKPRGLGTGLGLALVRRVAQSAGGSVEIESKVGKGTTVTMVLPVAARAQWPGAGRSNGSLPARLCAVVTIDDGRPAALVRDVLDSIGAHALIGAQPADADVWVVDATPDRLRQAEGWLARRAHGRLVLFGRPDAASAVAWRKFNPITIEQRDSLGEVRAALRRAVVGD